MVKRRNIELLPARTRSEELKRFFESTVDQVFQPGKADLISGYIGRKPSYFDAGKDFYKTEPTLERTERQLEPAVVTLGEDLSVERIAFYDDFVNHLRAAGGLTEDMERVLASIRYSWSPPVDLDKLLNFHNYYWVDDETISDTLTPPMATHVAQANQLVFSFPPIIPEFNGRPCRYYVTVDGAPVVFNVAAGNAVLATAPAAGAEVVTTIYADLVDTISGLEHAINPATGTPLSSGQRVRVVDWKGDHVYFVDGVGRSIVFTSDIEDFTGDRPYAVIDRTCKSRNLWSRRNRWVHRSTLPSEAVIQSSQAARPIVEFEPDMVLFNYGTFRIAGITCTASDSPTRVADANHVEGPILVADINGMPLNSVKVDNGHVLIPGDRLLVRQEVDNWTPKTFFAKDSIVYHLNDTYRSIADHISGAAFSASNWTLDPFAAINNQIFTVEEVVDGNTSVYGLVLDVAADVGAVTQLGSSSVEYWFDGKGWPEAQAFGTAPLFDIYDNNGVSFSDQQVYPNNDFNGCHVFGYADGHGADDFHIGKPLKYNEYGQIVFENNLETLVLRSNDEVVDAARFYAFDRAGVLEFDNSWHQAGADLQLFDGSVPVNLQANPNNDTPKFISRNQWFDHFSQVLSNQIGFTGEPYAINSFRDTAKDLSLGETILQHNAPLTKAMVLASDDDFNLIDAIHFAKREYDTFYSKFLTRFTSLMNSSAISPSSSAASWVDSVLSNLILTKQSDFSFALSRMGGGQFFIPPTPSYLGILPVNKPRVLTQDGVTYTLCHDGAMRRAFGDERDALILELENRIYDSIIAKFKSEDHGFIVDEFVYRSVASKIDNQYSRDEFNSILARRFEEWAQHNLGGDYRSNTEYSESDPFTWNYSSLIDGEGRRFDGHWRGIYRHVYGTDRPHLAPWEMLGFSEMPSWWTSEYGPAPYTAGNTQMWDDVFAGVIKQGPRAGISIFHIRTGNPPVNQDGELLNPIAAGVVPHAPLPRFAKSSWKFGDCGTAERDWYRSSNYRFSLCVALYLMRPADFVERTWDCEDRIIGPNGQPISAATGKRPKNEDVLVHGERVDQSQVITLGSQQWSSDYILSRGKSPALLGDALRRSDVRLAHRVAGFTTKENMRVVADNFGLVPTDDIDLILHQGASYKEDFYSGVLIEWAGNGYRVYGYDPSRASFTVFETDAYGPKTKLSNAEGGRSMNPWRANTYYSLGVLVINDGGVYSCSRPHTSGRSFEIEFWDLQPESALPDIDVFVPHATNKAVVVPYGTTFDSRQKVVDFLIGYGAWLESRGWVFGDSEAGVTDWIASARAFANASRFSWDEGVFISVSPAASKVTYHTEHGTVLNVEETLNGFYGIYDRNGRPIPREESFVDRNSDGLISITAGDLDIYGARVRVADIEHAIVFSNKTIFEDTIFEPLYNLRQPRLKVEMLRAEDWFGRFDAPGYILTDGEIRPSFDKSAENLRYMFDIEGAEDPTLRSYARHLIGFQTRDYLTSLNLSETQQFEFYQGLIQNKGTVSSFDRLLRSNIIGEDRQLSFREEWAVRVGSFGAANPYNRWEVEVRRDDLTNNTQLFYSDTAVVRDGWANLHDATARWINTPRDKTPVDFVFSETTKGHSDALPDCGYVRLSEADYISNDLNSLGFDISIEEEKALVLGDYVWTTLEDGGDWNIYKFRHLSTDGDENRLLRVYIDDSDPALPLTKLVLTNDHGLTSDDIGRAIGVVGTIDSLQPIEGMMTISDIDDDGHIVVDIEIFEGYDYTDNEGDVGPVMGIFESVRFANQTDFALCPLSYFAQGDLVYVDSIGATGWGVYRFDEVSATFSLTRREGSRVTNEIFRDCVLYDLDTRITETKITPQPSILDKIALLDYRIGKIPGAADRELTYKLDYDPAVYEGEQQWGANEVGKLWWDLSTVRFVQPYTDDLSRADITEAEFVAEMEYRVNNWAKVMPSTEVDIYEWVRSEVSPEQWIRENERDPEGPFSGLPVYDPLTQSIEKQEYSTRYNGVRTYYYFWVKNRLSSPFSGDRILSAKSCADLITNPSEAGVVWLAPISAKGMVLSNVGETLKSHRTVMQLDFQDHPYDGPRHQQWALVRVGDEESVPPTETWTKIIDSLVGFDTNMTALPDPNIHEYSSVGIETTPMQNVFSPRDGSARSGIFDARRSMVEMVNYILSRHDYSVDRQTGMDDLYVESDLSERLAWVQSDNSTYIEPLPPTSEFDVMVHSIDERDQFFLDRLYTKFMSPAPWDREGWDQSPWDADFTASPRVLINGLANERPFWSVWEIDLAAIPVDATKADLAEIIEDAIVPAKTFHYEVTSIAARDAIPNVKSGERVLVNDPDDASFWAIYAYHENASARFPAGFSHVNGQRYRTADFLNRADWYADGYYVEKPPVVTYANISERNRIEGEEPFSSLVKVLDDGSGRWVWTAFDRDESTWVTVAHENGTIQIDEAIFDEARLPYGWDGVGAAEFDYSHVAKRDGSFELRVLMRLLLDNNLLSALEINELFFSLVHFVHSQQDQVDWVFPTSYMSVVGYQEPLRASAIAQPDNIETIMSYLDEVKPYRVKTRDFVRGLLHNEDSITARCTDFDKPRYFDPLLKRYRSLDINDTKDLALIKSDVRWSEWFDNKSTSRIRSITPVITFDRKWPDNSLGVDSGAAYFINSAYEPSETMKEKNFSTLLDLSFNGTVIDARKEVDGVVRTPDVKIVGSAREDADIIINGVLRTKYTFGSQDALITSARPEELMVVKADDSLVVTIEKNWGQGVPKQQVMAVDVSGETAAEMDIKLSFRPQNRENLFVFQDGVALPNIAFSFDIERNVVTVPLLDGYSNRISQIAIRSMGYGSTTSIIDQVFLKSTGSATINVNIPSGSGVAVDVNGNQWDANIVSFNTSSITLTAAPPVGALVVVTIFGNAGYRLYTNVQSGVVSVAGECPFAVGAQNNASAFKPSETIVELNGVRLRPPMIYYGSFLATNRKILLEDYPTNPSLVQVWFDGVAKTLANVSIVDGVMYPVSGSVMVNEVVVHVYADEEFSYNGSTLTIPSAQVGDEVRVLSYPRNDALAVKTHVRDGRSDSTYLIETPIDQNYAYVTVDGKLAIEGFDYVIETVIDTYDTLPKDFTFFDSKDHRKIFRFFESHAAVDAVVFTTFSSDIASPPTKLLLATTTGSKSRHVGNGLNPSAWQLNRVNNQERGGILVNRLNEADNSIVVQSNPTGLPTTLVDSHPFDIPNPEIQKAGVVWVNGERIEYYSISNVGSVYTLSDLRRGTRGTYSSAFYDVGSAVYTSAQIASNFDKVI